MKNLFFALFWVFISSVFALNHSGLITSDENWDSSRTHFIDGDVIVDSGVTLTIEAGTTIRFWDGYLLRINGKIIANGTYDRHIKFSSTSDTNPTGSWKYIEFSYGDSGSVLNYCDIYRGGSSYGNIYLVNSGDNVQITNCDIRHSGTNGIYITENNSTQISNCTIFNNDESGIFCNYTDSTPVISNCEINDNGDYGIYCSSGASPMISDCDIRSNGNYAIKINANNLKNITGTMNITGNTNNAIYLLGDNIKSGRWLYFGVPLILGGNMTINNGESLIIDAGNILKFSGNYYFLVNGKILAQGTSSDRITFTSAQSTPSAGDWKSIFFYNADSGCELNYCNFYYGGSESDRGNIYIDESGNHVSFNNCNIEHSATNGVFIWANSSPSFINCVIKNNNSYGIKVYANSSHPIFGSNLSEWNDIYNNNGGGAGKSFRNSNTNNTVEYVYWGTVDESEINSLIYNSSLVDYTPWINSSHDTTYPQTNPDIPQNVTISVSQGNIHITWDAVSGATSYKVYSSDTPDGGFLMDNSGTFNGESWSAPISESRKFYYVTAVN